MLVPSSKPQDSCFKFVAEKDERIRVSDASRNYYFERKGDGKYASQDARVAFSAAQVAERIKDKSVFVFYEAPISELTRKFITSRQKPYYHLN